MSGPNPPGPDSEEQQPGSRPTGRSGQDQPTVKNAGESEFYSQAYSAPESEQFTSGPYVPAHPGLYDYDSYDSATEVVEEPTPPRWPWIVGVTAILAAIALVVSVSLLVSSTDTNNAATRAPTTASVPPAFCRSPVFVSFLHHSQDSLSGRSIL